MKIRLRENGSLVIDLPEGTRFMFNGEERVLERARELVQRGELGGLGPSCYSFMGALRDVARLESQTGPEVAERLREEGVDAALITPT